MQGTPQIVTLTTDFGQRDAYVAQMKGVLFSEGPSDLRVVDLSHEVTRHDVAAAAFFLRSAVPRFPEGSIHVAVIDPGVGSTRHPLIVRHAGRWLVGPDNGLWGSLYDGSEQVYAIRVDALEREVANTFHGRDVFAPAAARLASGMGIRGWTDPLADYVRHPSSGPGHRLEAGRLHGRVWHVDTFGNVITSIDEAAVRRYLGTRPGEGLALESHGVVGLRSHYAQVPVGRALMLIGSDGLLELAVREGRADERLGLRVGAEIRLNWREPGSDHAPAAKSTEDRG